MPIQTSMKSGEAREPSASQAWSRRAQIVFVSVAMPVLVLLLVAAPYVLTHYVVNRHTRFNYIPPPLGGARALEGHWTDAPVVPVRLVNFGADWSAFGWIAADDDLTTSVLPTAPGTVSQVFTSVGQSVAKDAPLFAIRTEAAKSNPADAPSTTHEIVVAAPVAGIVIEFNVTVGQVVKTTKPGAATKAASIADLSSVWLVAEIDENDARPLRPGQLVEARPTALDGRVYKGTLSSVSVDPDTRRATARIVVENSDGGLKLGMLAQFSLSAAGDSGTLAVPEGAVLFENDSARVFVVRDERSVRDVSSTRLAARAIRTGRVRDGMVEVVEGLALGENVEATDG
ncbi:MAG: efflux RND transporter periplasmic adaptor subunit, partial [Hyphomicrobiales bacterium]|nr:efflux RND transporter periplasmic adaptor subunit [Hyphomicrobiales bacterium]